MSAILTKRNSIVLGGVVMMLSACVTPEMPSRSGELPGAAARATGQGCASLVALRARTTAAGLAEENAWIAARYPGALRLSETYIDCNGTPADMVVFRHGQVEHRVMFDISSFFGRAGGDDLDDLLDG